ncbi:serine hydrolase domain-containing protein [Paenibacillus herberti]|uniref:Penicillin-binding protein n=1 Tax=Paenibacillus herberti TaxID=1619309 RepID=A0A229P1K7_9BACL|nr:serine hydrolase domain-containing protein [Paenibacillus herberti]OXM16133.1 penicillin-binding protein [Paenibacillus herberti]
MKIDEIVNKHNCESKIPFSGAILFGTENESKFEQSYGFANRSDKIKNTTNTRFGMASGCKIYTAVAICQLVDKGLLEFDTLISDLGINLSKMDPRITVHHLLTHTSGISDYFDEEFMTDYESLWNITPMYNMTSTEHFLPMFQNLPMKFDPGTQFSYSNSGFITLGLIVEKVTGLSFIDYVQKHIFRVCEMNDSGYFRMDQLPERTAIGYVDINGHWKTTIYSIPVVGGPDGGAYTTVYDLAKFWNALMGNRLLSKQISEKVLYPHIKDSEFIHYGYGVWIVIMNNEIFKYFIMGSDPGVVMQSSFYPKLKAEVHILSNVSSGAGLIASKIDEEILKQPC